MNVLNNLQKISSTGGLLNILREVDLGAVQGESEERFSLLVLGDKALTQPLAETLCTPKGEERAGHVHPWLTQASLNTTEANADLAILVAESTGSTALAKSDDTANTVLSEAATQTLTRLEQRGVPVVVVIVGAEGAKQEVPHKHEAARVSLGAPSAPTWSEEVETVLVPTLLSVLPAKYHLTFARHLPRFRGAVMRSLVDETSRANAIYAASTGVAEVVPVLNIPLNVADMIVLTKNQLIMAYKIALAAGKKGQPQEVMGEIIGVLGGGFLFRQVARQLVGLVPVWGIVPKVAVSYAGTWAIGQSVQLWAVRGKAPNKEDLRGFYDSALERGRSFAKGLLNRKGGEKLELEVTTPNAEIPTAVPEKKLRKKRFRLPKFRRTSPKVSPELPPSEEE